MSFAVLSNRTWMFTFLCVLVSITEKLVKSVRGGTSYSVSLKDNLDFAASFIFKVFWLIN